MSFYFTAFALGAIGLLAMALSGFLGGRSAHQGHTHAGHHSGHGHGHGHGTTHGHAHGRSQREAADLHIDGGMHDSAWSSVIAFLSPRTVFSLALGFGAAGLLVQNFLGGAVQLLAAILGGILFDRFLVTPLWNLTFRFASTPALSLESCLTDTAVAVTNFNAQGEGLIAVEVDGRNVQLLGTLQAQDREMGVRVRAGNQVRIEEVDAERNRCKVSLV